ncbi:hypothetical protein KHQ06_24490 [Nocardia tengchongensis]|uniref:Lipoprotein n=1 Tax=Nocardia tengchongensis TaxID=2055889 RepID=A0ABX8CHT1_9NOCA|nr:hypothetical protein [Nocardia tengchongensis]QVI19521.1 hypothetical protein KHQ06_24490 [Nocardia tengchongensis]
MVVLLSAAVLEGCAQPGQSENNAERNCRAAQFVPPFEHLDGCSPSQVVLAAMQTAFTYRPGQQADQGAAFQSATPLMDSALAARMDTTAHILAPITGQQWQRWRDLDVSVVATARLGADDHPPDTDVTFARVAAVILQPDNRDPSVLLTVFVRAARPDSSVGWRVSALEVRT